MKNRYNLLIVFLGLFSVGVGYFISNKINQPKNHTIVITKGGFTPDAVTISKGDRVTWINQDPREHWPASNFHPQHAEYPTPEKGCLGSALDACRGLKRGESYSFTFDKIGTWGMHDHLFYARTMIIKVVHNKPLLSVKPQAKSTQFIEDYENLNPQDFPKLNYEQKRTFIVRLSQKDPKAAWSYLKSAAIKKGEVVDYVHELAHIIGKALYDRYGLDGISACSKDFLYGCYHGVVSEALVERGTESISQIEISCMNIISERKGDPGECIHGIGHGLLPVNDINIPSALAGCDSLEVDINKEYCYQGVFMEYHLSNVPAKIDKESPWSFCNQFINKHKSACAAYLLSLLAQEEGYDIKQAGTTCKSSPDKTLWRQCMISLSSHIAVKSLGKVQTIMNDCAKIEDEGNQTYCIMMTSAWVKRLELPNNLITSEFLCNEIPPAFLKECETFSFYQN